MCIEQYRKRKVYANRAMGSDCQVSAIPLLSVLLQNEMKMKEHLSYKEQRPIKNIIENLSVIRVWGGKPHRQKSMKKGG